MLKKVLSALIGATLTLTPALGRADALVIFAAASLKNALDESAANFTKAGGGEVKISYGGSSTLAKQINEGAPADIFIAADEESMDQSAKAHALNEASRFDYLRNELVLVAAKNSALDRLELTNSALEQAIGSGHVATGEVNSVPVGRYARASLQKLGLWAAVEPHLAMTDNVRAALAFVARGEARLGIVYGTDARAESQVKVVAKFPEESHLPILYPVALTAASHIDDATKFVEFLKSAEVRAIFERQGFVTLK